VPHRLVALPNNLGRAASRAAFDRIVLMAFLVIARFVPRECQVVPTAVTNAAVGAHYTAFWLDRGAELAIEPAGLVLTPAQLRPPPISIPAQQIAMRSSIYTGLAPT
jgi:hypothetical protein